MAKTNTDHDNPPTNLNDLFEAAKPELRALHASARVRRMVTRERALELTGVLLDSWAPLVAQLDAELAPPRAASRKAELARVDMRAWVFYAADLAANESHADVPRKQRLELAARVNGHDRFLFKWAMPLFDDDPELSEALRDISRGTGARDDAEDVLRLVAMFRGNWNAVKGKTEVSKLLLDQAETDATAQLDLRRKAASNPARQLADAAYTLWFSDYDELMHLGRYLTRREADSTTRFPGVRGAITGSSVEVDEQTEDDGIEPGVDTEGGQPADAMPEIVDATR